MFGTKVTPNLRALAAGYANLDDVYSYAERSSERAPVDGIGNRQRLRREDLAGDERRIARERMIEASWRVAEDLPERTVPCRTLRKPFTFEELLQVVEDCCS